MNETNLDLFALSVLLILAVAMPLVGIWDFRRLLRWTEENRADARQKTYRWIMTMEWGLTIGLACWWFLAGRGPEAIGLVPEYFGWRWLGLGASLAASLYMVYQMITVMRDPEQLADLREKMGDLNALAPRSRDDNRTFTAVAITAGVCEEIVYRGFLMASLEPALGLWPAVALSSVVFGMGHAYQGFAGIVKTTAAGLAMALLTVFSGSLLAAIVLHAVVDLTSGRMMAAALAGPDADPTPRAPEALPSEG